MTDPPLAERLLVKKSLNLDDNYFDEIRNNMNKNNLILFFTFVFIGVISLFNHASGQTQKDILDIRERLIRLEEGQKALNQRLNDFDKRIDSLEKRIDSLEKRIDSFEKRIDSLEKRIDHIVNLIYVVLVGMFTLVGFVLWDRRSALAPAIRRTRDIEEREERLERAIKEYALKNPDMKEILKSLGLL